VPCQYARHGTAKGQSVVRLANRSTWYDSIIVGWFLLLREANVHVLQRGGGSEEWEMRDIQYQLGLWIVSLFFLLKSHFIFACMIFLGHYIVLCRAHRFEELCHGKNPGNLVPTKLINGCLPELRHKLFLAVIGCGARLSSS